MDEPRTATTLENDPSNPCIGCGPENPHGLQLSFERMGARVVTTLGPNPHWQGWPGRLHSGILYTAMLEVANWTVYGLEGRIGLPVRTSALDLRRWIGIDEALTLEGQLTRGDDERVVAVQARAGDEVVATLTRGFALPDRATFLARMGYEAVPSGLEGTIPD